MMKIKVEDKIQKEIKDYSGQNVVLNCSIEGKEAVVSIELAYSGVFGMGEKYDALNQKGKRVVNQVNEKFCFQGDKTYCPAPFFWTNTGFGLSVDSDETSFFAFEEDRILVRFPSASTFNIFTGTPDQIIREYMASLGESILPPKWVFEPWISANRWNNQEVTEEVLEKLKRYQFPASVIVLEAWSDEATFYIWNGAKYIAKTDGAAFEYSDFDFTGSPWPDPKKMIKKIHDAGLKLLLWQIPVYKKQDPTEIDNMQNNLDREDAVKNSLIVKEKDGSPYEIPKGNWFAGSMIPDFTNPKTVEKWFNKRKYLLDMGVDGFKTDGGEFIHKEDVVFADGTTGKEGKNRYSADYTMAYSKFIGTDRALFSRAGWMGQHMVPIHWAGDQQSQNCEMKSALTAGLSAALTGMLFWGFDLAGFAGPLPTADLYLRATQLACFTPIMQYHSEPDGGQFKELMPGCEGNNERTPWNMAEMTDSPKLMDDVRFYHWLRMNLIPYLWQTAKEAVKDSIPMMRPLIYDWYEDEEVLKIDDMFMLGSSILVAPLLEENRMSRRVYLPKGEWTAFFSRRVYHGESYIESEEEGKIPVYVKHGTAVPLYISDKKIGAPFDYNDKSKKLHFLLAGSSGRSEYTADDDQVITITWDGDQVQVINPTEVIVTYEII